MSAADTIERLDAALAEDGEDITIRRGATSIATKGKFRALAADSLVTGWGGKQGKVRGVISPTGIAALLPLRTGDKLVRGGQERAICWADPIAYGGTVVRINIDVEG